MRDSSLFVFHQVLRDTTRRGHKLYDMTENDRQICLADGDYDGKIVEIEPEEEEEGEAEKHNLVKELLSEGVKHMV